MDSKKTTSKLVGEQVLGEASEEYLGVMASKMAKGGAGIQKLSSYLGLHFLGAGAPLGLAYVTCQGSGVNPQKFQNAITCDFLLLLLF